MKYSRSAESDSASALIESMSRETKLKVLADLAAEFDYTVLPPFHLRSTHFITRLS